ncbi:MAG: hypothetical protein K0S32_948 [Bacteroidetes bacterium]|jgi:hypothetical protein|nr:hypothetical protein [Bacteroidota bacterium]
MKKIIVIMLALFFVQANTLMAQKPGVVVSKKEGWHKIGEVSASFKMENESIVVLGADVFKSIKIKVTDAPLNLLILQVYYETGEVEDIPVKSELKAGSETREIAIKQKDIKKVSFTYKTLPNTDKDKAQVELYGLK